MRNFQKVKIDPASLARKLSDAGVSMCQASGKIGKSPAYISSSISRGEMGKTAFDLLCTTFDFDPRELIQKEAPAPAKKESLEAGYNIRMNVTPEILTLAFLFGEEVVYIARSKIKGNRELDLVQAISYAAHLIYKFSEQKYFERGETE